VVNGAISAVTTLAGFLGSGLQLMRVSTARNLLLSLFITSLSFFLFSYHVHEKYAPSPRPRPFDELSSPLV
jgi:hypothetical protein